MTYAEMCVEANTKIIVAILARYGMPISIPKLLGSRLLRRSLKPARKDLQVISRRRHPCGAVRGLLNHEGVHSSCRFKSGCLRYFIKRTC